MRGLVSYSKESLIFCPPKDNHSKGGTAPTLFLGEYRW